MSFSHILNFTADVVYISLICSVVLQPQQIHEAAQNVPVKVKPLLLNPLSPCTCLMTPRPANFLSSSLPAPEWQTVSRAALNANPEGIWQLLLYVCKMPQTGEKHPLCLRKPNMSSEAVPGRPKAELKVEAVFTATTRARIAEHMQRMGRRSCCSQSCLKAQSHP